jgi:hypothetical protein
MDLSLLHLWWFLRISTIQPPRGRRSTGYNVALLALVYHCNLLAPTHAGRTPCPRQICRSLNRCVQGFRRLLPCRDWQCAQRAACLLLRGKGVDGRAGALSGSGEARPAIQMRRKLSGEAEAG